MLVLVTFKSHFGLHTSHAAWEGSDFWNLSGNCVGRVACCGSRPGMSNSQLWDPEHHHMTRNYRFLPGNVPMPFSRGGFGFVGLIVAGVIQWPSLIILLSLITRWALPDCPRVRMWGYSKGADVAGRRELREMCRCLPAQDREGVWFLLPH